MRPINVLVYRLSGLPYTRLTRSCYRLMEAHRLLVEKGLIKRMDVRPGYLDVMRLATSRQRAMSSG